MYLIFLINILILIIFIFFNSLLNKEKFNIENNVTNSWLNFCDAKPKSALYNPNFKAYHSNVTDESITVEKCGKENEKCWTDTKGQNTCCGDLNCVRLKNNYGYKVCSYQKDACGYFKNDFLKYIFDDKYWKKYFKDIQKYFDNSYDEIVVEEGGNSILKNKRDEILKFLKTKESCGDKYYNVNDLRKKLDDFFKNDMIFDGLIYGAKKVYNDNKTESNEDDRDCRDKSGTLNLF